jgi:hypothetical protein
MKKKKITGSDVGIIFSIVGIIASILVIIINASKNDSVGVGIGLLLFCILTLSTNVRNKRNEK